MENIGCFDCLQRRISSDFSDKLVFSYGISDSPLPFGSTAVVQMPEASADVSAQFMLVYLPVREDDCLTVYVNEFLGGNCEGGKKFGDNTLLSSKVNQDQAEVSFPSDGTTSSGSSMNKSQFVSNRGEKLCLPGLGPKVSTCKCSGRFSCFRTISALAPLAHVGVCSSSNFEDLASNFLSGSMEDHVLSSLGQLLGGKPTGRDSINFLGLLGMPSFDDSNFPGSLRHPNIAPVVGMLKAPSYVNLVLPNAPYTLANVLHFSPSALKSEWHVKFLIYQVLSAVVYIHGLGVAHGNLCPSNILLTSSCWSWLRILNKPHLTEDKGSIIDDSVITWSSKMSLCIEDCLSQGLYTDLKLSFAIDWNSEFNRWWRGELSNFDYLLILNRLAGRRWGDHTFHTVMPWVVDFSVKPDEKCDAGWRDLSKSKWRLAKGDEQLDFTYSTSEIPHHISDECLSELAVCSYKARRLPLSVLRTAVRSVYEPNEYPSTMQRLYQWTPDECIPEFYCNSRIFQSVHSGMADLAVPSWAANPDDFIKLHRDALESDRVSSQLHHWIDITFGYKMSGQAAVAAKNVMLPSVEPTIPRSIGRHQLFHLPHPCRLNGMRRMRCRSTASAMDHTHSYNLAAEKHQFCDAASLQDLEEVAAFCENAQNLSPSYFYTSEEVAEEVSLVEDFSGDDFRQSVSESSEIASRHGVETDVDIGYLLEHLEVDDEGQMGYQELLLWRQKASHSKTLSEDGAKDIFAVGCILAELHLRRPLFNLASLSIYLETGVLPGLIQELPPCTKLLVGACIQRDWRRRPSAKSLLESPYFDRAVKSSYLFLAPLHLLAKDGSRLSYIANFAKRGVFKAMGTSAAEKCVLHCLPLIVTSLSDNEAEWACMLLKEFLRCLRPVAATGYSHLKVSLLQDSFFRELWTQIGKQAYLEAIHSLVVSNLHNAPDKGSAAAASVLLIGSSEELGMPITVHQTIMPLIQCFGRGLCTDGIDALVRIGGLFGENFIVRHILPLLKSVVHSAVDVSFVNKPEPVQSWVALALIDCFMTLDGLASVLPIEVIVKELIEGQPCLYVKVLMQMNLEMPVLQVAATSLISVCQRIGADSTALHVLPQLKELFDELAFSQETVNGSGPLGRRLRVAKQRVNEEPQIETRMDLVFVMYPSLASLLGIEKLRQCCATWLLLEQFLLRYRGWKWEYTGESSRAAAEVVSAKKPAFRSSALEYNPAKLLLNGVGWSIPQSQGSRGPKNFTASKRFYELHQKSVQRHVPSSNHGTREPWFWFPSPAVSWDGPDFLGRVGGIKDELPWKIRASIVCSVRAHHGALRSLVVCPDELTILTAGVGPGFKGTVQKWDLTRVDCVSGYYGHEEVVNDICVLSSSGRIASCDGTLHVWNSHTGKLISAFAEPSVHSAHHASPTSPASKIIADQANMLNSNTLSSGILNSAFDGSLYTCLHHLEHTEKLAVGTGNGCLRFIDAVQGQKLHLWKSESTESSFSSLVSTISSSGTGKAQADEAASSASWIAAGFSSGICKLLDARSGNVIASWRAHDGYITKLVAPQDHLLVSSSHDKTLRVWDLRRNYPPVSTVITGHADGVSSFSLWGQDVISISRDRIGLSNLSRSPNEDGKLSLTPQKLYNADSGMRNLSMLSSISILPFSRLFLVGTEDGYLKICC
ncbi:BEACH domain [Dillenia turbinata]|uniref:BEACH domain n=1 Tax=Dillenia turbinata TaxID=194707 RepID=A0AAN8YXX2_9MAGN